jgi:2-methylcitrate dehydratase
MSQTIQQQIAQMIVSTDAASLPAASLDALRTSVADTIACAVGASRLHDAPNSGRILDVLGETGIVPIVGTRRTASVGAAAFVNASLARYLDFNDTFMGARNPAHPSDVVLGLVGLAAHLDAPGPRLAEAIVAGYAVVEWINDHCTLMRRGWDLVTPVAIGAAAGAARLLGLDAAQAAHAVGIAVVDNVTLFQTRVGEISEWKGFASGSAARKGLFCAQMAAAGVTGPEAVFEGRSGFFAQTGCEPDTDSFETDLWKQAPARVCLKAFPVQYLVQAAVEAGVRIHERGVAPAHIACIKVRANSELIRGTAADRTRWAPRTRETADHSLPFCLAVPILHGSMRIEHFDDATLRDTRIADLMNKVEVEHDPALSSRYPKELDLMIAVHQVDGSSFELSIPAPPGYLTRPLTPQQVRNKFAGLVGGSAEDVAVHLERMRGLVDAGSVRAAFEAIVHSTMR